jgi:hypothetical protein
VLGTLKHTDFCGKGVCAEVMDSVNTALGLTGPSGKKFADCPGMGTLGIGKSIDLMYSEMNYFCGKDVDALDAACHLSTVTYTTDDGMGFDTSTCTEGMNEFTCSVNSGRCGKLQKACTGDKTKGLIEAKLNGMLAECSKSVQPSDECKKLTIETVALLESVDARARVQGDEVGATNAVCMSTVVGDAKLSIESEDMPLTTADGITTFVSVGKEILTSGSTPIKPSSSKVDQIAFKYQLLLQLSLPSGVGSMSTQALSFAGATKDDVAAAKAAVDRQILVAESADTGADPPEEGGTGGSTDPGTGTGGSTDPETGTGGSTDPEAGTGGSTDPDTKEDSVTDGAFATAGPSLAAAAIALFALGCN